jgi:hypothetical protein
MTTTQWDDEASPQPGITLRTASTIRPAPIAWIWPGWLAAGKLHVLAGMAGPEKLLSRWLWQQRLQAGEDGPIERSAGLLPMWLFGAGRTTRPILWYPV